jgi:hypothetical protein
MRTAEQATSAWFQDHGLRDAWEAKSGKGRNDENRLAPLLMSAYGFPPGNDFEKALTFGVFLYTSPTNMEIAFVANRWTIPWIPIGDHFVFLRVSPGSAGDFRFFEVYEGCDFTRPHTKSHRIIEQYPLNGQPLKYVLISATLTRRIDSGKQER